MNIDIKQLRAIAGRPVEAHWVELVNKYTNKYDITTKKQLAMFLAQCVHESAGFATLVENLNYSQEGLLKTFPKYFPTAALAASYARKPVAIASRVYANRMGNGNEASQEGHKYRGRGCIQCTGKDNVTACSQFIFNDTRLVDNPDWLATPEGAMASACWFWSSNNLNKFADVGDIVGCTRRINGGTIGLAHRRALYAIAMEAL